MEASEQLMRGHKGECEQIYSAPAQELVYAAQCYQFLVITQGPHA